MVERYLSADEPEDVAASALHDPSVAARMLSTAGPMRLVSCIYLLDDHTSLTLFEAPSVDAVREALAAAGVLYHRIGEAVDLEQRFLHLRADPEAC